MVQFGRNGLAAISCNCSPGKGGNHTINRCIPDNYSTHCEKRNTNFLYFRGKSTCKRAERDLFQLPANMTGTANPPPIPSPCRLSAPLLPSPTGPRPRPVGILRPGRQSSTALVPPDARSTRPHRLPRGTSKFGAVRRSPASPYLTDERDPPPFEFLLEDGQTKI